MTCRPHWNRLRKTTLCRRSRWEHHAIQPFTEDLILQVLLMRPTGHVWFPALDYETMVAWILQKPGWTSQQRQRLLARFPPKSINPTGLCYSPQCRVVHLARVLPCALNAALLPVGRVKPGILNLPTTNSLAWTKERHHGVGNIGMADGSAQQTTTRGFYSAVIAATNGAPASTYRLVIP